MQYYVSQCECGKDKGLNNLILVIAVLEMFCHNKNQHILDDGQINISVSV